MGKQDEAYKFIEKYPTMELQLLYKKLPHIGQSTIRKQRLKYLETLEPPKEPKNKNKKKKKAHNIPPYEMIDDPDELLYSVSMRELNRRDPDPRWASILLNTLKERKKIKLKEGQLLQKQSISSLVGKLKKKLPEELKQEILRHSENTQKA